MSSFEECRIPLLSSEEAVERAKKVGIAPHMAELNVFKALLHHPDLAEVMNHSLTMFMGKGNLLPPRLRELIIMRIGWETGSNYEWTQHWRVSKMFGIPDQDLIDIRAWQESECFDNQDRVVLQATDEILQLGKISAQTWSRLVKELESVALALETLGAICNWRTFSQLLLSLEVPLEEGVNSWPPDGSIPVEAA